MPFMQAIGMEKDELVQALGVFFTTATVALSFNLADAGLLTMSATLAPATLAMIAAFLGMYIGQIVRARWTRTGFAAGSWWGCCCSAFTSRETP